MIAHSVQRILAVIRGQYFVTLEFQNAPREMPQRWLILDDEHGFRPSWRRPGSGAGRDIQRLIDSWKINLEGRTLTKFALYGDVTSGLLHDRLARRQA